MASIMSVLENVSSALEKCVYSCVVGWSVTLMLLRFSVLFRFCFLFLLDFLFNCSMPNCKEALKSPALLFNYPFLPSVQSVFASYFGAYMFTTVLSF